MPRLELKLAAAFDIKDVIKFPKLQVLEVGLEVAEVVHGGSLLAAACLITAVDVVGSLEV